MLSVVNADCHLRRVSRNDVECHYAERRVLFIIILNVITLSVIMLSVIMLSVIILSVIMLSVVMIRVMAPFFGKCINKTSSLCCYSNLCLMLFIA